MKIGVIIPDRGDRPQFLKNLWRMLSAQTVLPTRIELVSDPPLNDKCDITKRYRIGYDKLRNQGLDVIALMENDDYYAPGYLETMYKAWDQHNKPDIFGTAYTIYYHLKLRAYFTMNHDRRASAMNTLIKPDLKIVWPPDHEAYTDLHLWLKSGLKKATFKPEKIISVGMKHGVGLCGGRSHVDRLDRYLKRGEFDRGFLQNTLDPESYKFYSTLEL